MSENGAPALGGPLLVGIDAGGSKTRALVGGAGGAVLGWGEAGPANYQSTGLKAAFQALDAAVEQALERAGAGPERDPAAARALVGAACLGAAGMDRPKDFAVFQGWAERAFPNARLRLVNDAHIALAAGTPAGWGLVLIAGTGSIAYGRSPDGRVERAGGWGYLLGDEGSGYDIGLQALRAVTRASDGRAPQTTLTEAVLAAWALDHPQDLVSKLYGGLPRAEIARLAPLVERCAEQGDAVAAGILAAAGEALADAAAAVVRRLGLEGAVPTALAGGVLLRGERVRGALLRGARDRGLELSPVEFVRDPAEGALRLAARLLETA